MNATFVGSVTETNPVQNRNCASPGKLVTELGIDIEDNAVQLWNA